MTVGEIVYIVLDLCKLISDDTIINEDHALFLLKKYRAFLIKKEQEREKSTTDIASDFEYQEICLDLEKAAAIDGEPCTGGYYLRTKQKMPKILEGTTPRVYPVDYYQGTNIVYIPRDRMRYIGTNPFLKNIIYVSLGPDFRLYLNSTNPQYFYLKKLRVNALFEDFDEAAGLLCDSSGTPTSCDVMDEKFPIRDYLVPTLLELVLKQVLASAYRPKDTQNDSDDALASLETFIRNNVKSALQKQIEG